MYTKSIETEVCLTKILEIAKRLYMITQEAKPHVPYTP